jgi:hypothetical protein
MPFVWTTEQAHEIITVVHLKQLRAGTVQLARPARHLVARKQEAGHDLTPRGQPIDGEQVGRTAGALAPPAVPLTPWAARAMHNKTNHQACA